MIERIENMCTGSFRNSFSRVGYLNNEVVIAIVGEDESRIGGYIFPEPLLKALFIECCNESQGNSFSRRREFKRIRK